MFGSTPAPEARAHPLFPGGRLAAENLARAYFDLKVVRRMDVAKKAQKGAKGTTDRPAAAPDEDPGGETSHAPAAPYRRPNQVIEEERQAEEARAEAARRERERRKAIAEERQRQQQQRQKQQQDSGVQSPATNEPVEPERSSAPPARGSKAARKLEKQLKKEARQRRRAEAREAWDQKQRSKRVDRRIPRPWLEAGDGWATQFFSDLEPYDPSTESPGVHRCELHLPNGKPCPYVVSGGESFLCGWAAAAEAPKAMVEHLAAEHSEALLLRPRRRRWVTGADGQKPVSGFWDGCFCAPCQMQRQVAAFHGYRNASTSKWDCLAHTCCCPCSAHQLRKAAVGVHNIDEHPVATCVYAFFCTPCSIAEVHNELAADDLWPGGECERMAPLGLMHEEVRDDEPTL
eukprot:CAMPEP_0174863040 /NCGR_PEP_ID=MMETSP1114-20130205/55434_1 /TAXON_ID=312471 /ORGANISM="Neobodo designis, Strain CCAP 1951/1" /LENGTH=402 /DNA_ID=CAMNT_0016098101 /DNA_START=119 /DNA_END=1324 /DNA_ORIENTATION=+